MKLTALVQYLDELLNVRRIDDEAVNGLQVEGRAEVSRVGFAVDYSPELASAAARDGMDMLFVHHGMIRGGLQSIRGVTLAYLKPLILSEISLYAAHLPLDVHPELSHNARMAKMLEVPSPRPFGEYRGNPIGVIGTLVPPVPREEFLARIQRTINRDAHFLPFGHETVSQVAIVSGGGAGMAIQAGEEGADFYLTGEPSHSSYHQIKSAGLNVCFAGHYQTEKWGVLALMEHLMAKGWVESHFYDIPTPF